MIKQLSFSDLDIATDVISKSFETVAKEFNLTKENCPNHTSFIKQIFSKYNLTTDI